jgi:hypothetical protein
MSRSIIARVSLNRLSLSIRVFSFSCSLVSVALVFTRLKSEIQVPRKENTEIPQQKSKRDVLTTRVL